MDAFHIPTQNSQRKAVISCSIQVRLPRLQTPRVKGMSKITPSFIHMIFILDSIIKANHKLGK